MQINQDYNTASYAIRAYREGEIIVIQPLGDSPSEQDRSVESLHPKSQFTTASIKQSVVILPDRIDTQLLPETAGELELSHFEQLRELGVELVILGTGKKLSFPHPSIMASMLSKRVGLEVMDTAGACRTYNFLVSDGRKVAAALFMI